MTRSTNIYAQHADCESLEYAYYNAIDICKQAGAIMQMSRHASNDAMCLHPRLSVRTPAAHAFSEQLPPHSPPSPVAWLLCGPARLPVVWTPRPHAPPSSYRVVSIWVPLLLTTNGQRCAERKRRCEIKQGSAPRTADELNML